jgi:acyl carrier protein
MDKITEETILDIMHNALKLKEKRLTVNSTMQDIEEWDSLGHLSILVALDKFFNGKISGIKELASADSIRKILQILKENSLM